MTEWYSLTRKEVEWWNDELCWGLIEGHAGTRGGEGKEERREWLLGIIASDIMVGGGV